MTVTIVGAGVAGLVAATVLSERGFSVEVIDRGPSSGPHACSWHAGGMLAPGCESETSEELVWRLGQESIGWWAKRVPGVTRGGSLVVTMSRDRRELDHFARRTTGHRLAGPHDLATLEPDLSGRFEQALYYPDEAHLKPRLALASLTEKLVERGIPVRFGTMPETHGSAGKTVVDARGFAARDQLSDLRGVRGEMLLVRCRDIHLSRPVRLLHPRFPAYIVPHGHGYMIGATQIESESRAGISARGAVDLLNAAYAVHPAFGEAEIIETGADVRPAFADNLPRIRRRGQTFYINGLFRHGFLLAPACARMLAEVLENPDTIAEIMDENHRQRQNA